jgi:hypothetical protein
VPRRTLAALGAALFALGLIASVSPGASAARSPEPTPPPLHDALVHSQCVDGVPWVVYDVELVNLDGQPAADGTATFTFTSAAYPGESFVTTVSIGAGRFLWPGATAEHNEDGSFTATNWPGYAPDVDGWAPVGDENYGWTRDGVDVTIGVDPSMTVSLAYPPPSELCVAAPPIELHAELDAPPATSVEAEAQFAG